MRKIIVQEMLSIDGFFAGVDGEIDWHVVDAEFNEHAIGFLDTIDTLIFGRITYDLMAGYWPTPEGVKDNALIAAKMNSLAKLVFSRTLEKAEWNNSKVVKEIVAADIRRMKEAPGKNIAIFGSGMIVSALARLGLIDEYCLIVSPVALGKGKTLFADVEEKLKFRLLETKKFKSGNVLLCYESVKT